MIRLNDTDFILFYRITTILLLRNSEHSNTNKPSHSTTIFKSGESDHNRADAVEHTLKLSENDCMF